MKMLLSNGITARNACGNTTSPRIWRNGRPIERAASISPSGNGVDARAQRFAHERRRVDGERDDREHEEREADVEPGQAEDREHEHQRERRVAHDVHVCRSRPPKGRDRAHAHDAEDGSEDERQHAGRRSRAAPSARSPRGSARVGRTRTPRPRPTVAVDRVRARATSINSDRPPAARAPRNRSRRAWRRTLPSTCRPRRTPRGCR